MLLQPKTTKYKKIRKSNTLKYNFKSKKLKFGFIGLKAKNSGMITSRQIEAARQAISRKLNKKGKLWIKIFPHLPITAKPSQSRMGKGKGNVSHWAIKIKTGQILFETCGITEQLAIIAFKAGKSKLPVKTFICF